MKVTEILSEREIEALAVPSDRVVESTSFYTGSIASITVDSAVTISALKRAGIQFAHDNDGYYKNIPIYESNGVYRVSEHDIKKHALDTILMDSLVSDSRFDPIDYVNQAERTAKIIQTDVLKGLTRNNVQVVADRVEHIGSYRHAIRDLFTDTSPTVTDLSEIPLPGECFEIAIFGIHPERVVGWINGFQHSVLSHSDGKNHSQYIAHGKIGITRYNLYGDDSLTVLCTENSIVKERSEWLSLVKGRWFDESGRVEEI